MKKVTMVIATLMLTLMVGCKKDEVQPNPPQMIYVQGNTLSENMQGYWKMNSWSVSSDQQWANGDKSFQITDGHITNEFHAFEYDYEVVNDSVVNFIKNGNVDYIVTVKFFNDKMHWRNQYSEKMGFISQ